MGPTLGFDTKQRNSFLIKFGVFLSKILTILFIVKYEKITLFDEFLVFFGPIISSFFACSNEENNKQKQQRVVPLVVRGSKRQIKKFYIIHLRSASTATRTTAPCTSCAKGPSSITKPARMAW